MYPCSSLAGSGGLGIQGLGFRIFGFRATARVQGFRFNGLGGFKVIPTSGPSVRLSAAIGVGGLR